MRLLPFFRNKCGVVIGGRLRWQFNALVRAARETINVDNCPANQKKPENVDYATDAGDLSFASDGTLDFVCSSHVLEHLANPLGAIAEWKRVTKDEGIFYVAVPDMRYTFDCKRDRTSLSHLVDDFEKKVDQADQSHVAEFAEKFAHEKACGTSREQLLEQVRDKLGRQVHNHVWTVDDMQEVFEYMGIKMVYGPILRKGTVHLIGQKAGR
jgi:predicted SAM-dependent methyltransferase